MLKFLKALAVFAGTIIGVGIFALPYAASKAGFFIVLLFFFIIAIVSIFNHLIYGEISLGTKGLHRLPGYTEKYLGRRWKMVAFASIVVGIFGALLAYLIVGGEFLRLFFSQFLGGNSLVYTLLFFSFGAFLIFRGIKSISQIEIAFLGIFFILLIIFFVKALPFINTSYFQAIDWKFITFPYGIILFSLWGLTTVPEIKEMLGGDRRLLRKTIISGITLATIVYLFFIIVIFGASGPLTTKTAMSGFYQVLGGGIVNLGFIFGVITCFTSFITLGLVFKKMLWYDMGLPKNLAWFITCFFPLTLFLLGFNEFLDIIGLAGAFGVGVAGTVVVFVYREFLRKTQSRRMHPALYLLPVLLVIGIIFEIFYFVFTK